MKEEKSNKFQAGSEIQLVSDSTRVGVVVKPDCLHGGAWFYLVNFGGDRKIVPETDLIPYLPQQRPFDILKAGKLGNHDEFLRNILFYRMAVAYGLTWPKPMLQKYVLPKDAPDHTPPPLLRRIALDRDATR